MKFTWKKIAASCFLSISAFLYWQDNGLMVTEYMYETPKLPKAFDGYRVVQISDLQNKRFGKNQYRLADLVEQQRPDIIVITGDLLDRNRTDVLSALELIVKLVPIAPVYYVSGNHEHQSGVYDTLLPLLKKAGVHILENKGETIEREGDAISVLGIKDRSVNSNYEQVIQRLAKEAEPFQILLSHRPEVLKVYARQGVDLVFTGHAHGGQIRLPFVGGVFAPHQGFFPKYTSGIYTMKDTSMVVSRGLGNSTFPFRIWNRPEIVVVTLQTTLA